MQAGRCLRLIPVSLLAALTLLVSGCVAPVQVSTLDSYGRPDLTPHYDHRPEDLGDRLDADDLIDTLARARRIERVFPSRSGDLYLEAARRAYGRIVDPQTAPYDRALIVAELYNRAVAGYIRTAPPNREDDRVTFSDRAPVWADPAYFDRFTPAADLRIEGLREHHVQPGVGAALIGFRDNNADEDLPLQDYYPPEGITRPITAVLFFDQPDRPRLVLYDPRQIGTVELLPPPSPERLDSALPFTRDPVELPLAADFTAPYADLLSRTQELAALGFAAMLNPDEAADRLGIYLLEDYDPDKTPLLMIHGLMSTPLTWIEATNAVYGDPELRDQYQVWHFLYPTATCPYYSAHQLREKLDAARLFFDPDLDDFASQDVVVVGHSMGGILTRTLVSDTGMDAWNIAFTVPPEELEGDPETIDFLKSVYVYDSKPYIHRVVFVATPHRGSEFAVNLIGQFGNSLVRLPRYCTDKTIAVARANRDRLQPGYGPWLLDGPPSSIQILRPDSPASVAPDLVPIRDGVTYHSIIGTRFSLPDGKGGTDSSDGIVEYWSSHLVGAASETFVPSGHNVHDHPDGVAEIKRILKLHLAERAAAAVARR
ncbi:MAG: alpha/beta fold hydrolase [Planctomycetota bacterium]